MPCFSITFNPKSKRLLKKSLYNLTDSDNPSNHQKSTSKESWGNTVDFFKVFNSIYKGKMEQILLTYGLPKEAVHTIMMFYKNMKAMFCSSDGDTNFFDIVARGYISTIFVYTLLRLCTLNMNTFKKKKKKKK